MPGRHTAACDTHPFLGVLALFVVLVLAATFLRTRGRCAAVEDVVGNPCRLLTETTATLRLHKQHSNVVNYRLLS